MKKKLVSAAFFTALLSAFSVSASDYDLCTTRARDDINKLIACNNDEVRSQMRQINQKLAQIAKDAEFGKLNQGQTSLENQFKYWQAYRNNFCAYAGVAIDAYGSVAYFKSDCMRLLTQKYNTALENLLNDASAVY